MSNRTTLSGVQGETWKATVDWVKDEVAVDLNDYEAAFLVASSIKAVAIEGPTVDINVDGSDLTLTIPEEVSALMRGTHWFTLELTETATDEVTVLLHGTIKFTGTVQ